MINTLSVRKTSTSNWFSFLCLIAISTFALATAQAQSVGNIAVSDAWIRASAPKQVNGAGYATIQNNGAQADQLINASADVAERLELHTIINENGVAQMRQVTGIDIPAGGTTKLAPGGFHVMFLKLKTPFEAGKTVPIKFTFEKAGDVVVNFEVKPITYNPNGGSTGHGGHAMPGMKH